LGNHQAALLADEVIIEFTRYSAALNRDLSA